MLITFKVANLSGNLCARCHDLSTKTRLGRCTLFVCRQAKRTGCYKTSGQNSCDMFHDTNQYTLAISVSARYLAQSAAFTSHLSAPLNFYLSRFNEMPCVFSGDELNICGDDDDDFGLKDADKLKNQCRLAGLPPHSPSMPVLSSSASSAASTSSSCMSTTADPNNPSKPRIWSLADVATSTSPSTGGLQSHQRNSGIHVGPPGVLRTPHPQLPPNHTLPGHPHPSLATSPKSDTNSQFHPAVNGFRPWVNGASYAGGPTGPAASQPPSGLLRPYPVAPRTEVH